MTAFGVMGFAEFGLTSGVGLAAFGGMAGVCLVVFT